MRVLVAGAGAVGSYLGASLAVAGAEVCLVARDAHGAAMAQRGLRVAGDPPGHLHLPVFASVSQAQRQGPYDLGLVAVKSYVTPELAAEWAGLGAPPALVSFQNGLGNEERLEAALPGHCVIRGSLTQAVQILEPGVVMAWPKGGVGLADCCPLARDLATMLRRGGLPVRLYRDGVALKWSKLLLNLIGAASSAVLGWPPPRLLRLRELFHLELAAWREAWLVLRATGRQPVNLPGYPVARLAPWVAHLPERLLHAIAPRFVGRERGDRLPGVVADLAQGQGHTEIEVLNGAVASEAARLGLAAPVNAALASLVAELAQGGRPREAYLDRPAAYLAELEARLTSAASGASWGTSSWP